MGGLAWCQLKQLVVAGEEGLGLLECVEESCGLLEGREEGGWQPWQLGGAPSAGGTALLGGQLLGGFPLWKKPAAQAAGQTLPR